MTRDNFPVAVIGGGPIGLSAAVHLLQRGLPVKVYEAGVTVAASVRDWGHVRRATPKHAVPEECVVVEVVTCEPVSGPEQGIFGSFRVRTGFLWQRGRATDRKTRLFQRFSGSEATFLLFARSGVEIGAYRGGNAGETAPLSPITGIPEWKRDE